MTRSHFNNFPSRNRGDAVTSQCTTRGMWRISVQPVLRSVAGLPQSRVRLSSFEFSKIALQVRRLACDSVSCDVLYAGPTLYRPHSTARCRTFRGMKPQDH